MSKTIAYLRISTDKQDMGAQRLACLEYANQQGFQIDQFVEVQMSSRKSIKARQLDTLLDDLDKGDRLLVAELSRLGRSIGQIVQLVDQLVKKSVTLVAIKESIILDGKPTINTKVMYTLFGLFAEIERDLISERVKEGVAAARAKGKLVGRPKGRIGKSRLDGKEDEIKEYLAKDIPKTTIGKLLGVSRGTIDSFIKSRKLEE